MKRSLAVKELTLIALFVAATAVLAQVAIPLPFSPVPISFGLVAVYMTGIFLKPHHAVLAQVCYLLLGAIGAPVFGNFRGGLAALFGPTGGYLMVYPLMAGIVAFALNSRRSLEIESRRGKKPPFLKATVAIILAHAVIYLGGTAWLSVITGNTFFASLAIGVYPYIPLDIVKIIFCITAVVPLRARFMSMNLLAFDRLPQKQAKTEGRIP